MPSPGRMVILYVFEAAAHRTVAILDTVLFFTWQTPSLGRKALLLLLRVLELVTLKEDERQSIALPPSS